MEEIMAQEKWTTNKHIKGLPLSEEGDVVYMVELEGSYDLWFLWLFQKIKRLIPTSTAPN